MTIRLILLGLVLFALISCQGFRSNTTNTNSDSLQKHDLPPILDSIKNKISWIDLPQTFNLDKESDDKVDEKLLKLDKTQVDYFYSTDDLRKYHEYFSFHSYFYGYNLNQTGLTKLFIINTNFETAIYLDCFILNSDGQIVDMFRPSYIEMQPTYGMIGYGSFNNDSIYKFIGIDYETVDELNDISIKDSSITTYELSRFGKINKSTLKFETDTIYGESE